MAMPPSGPRIGRRFIEGLFDPETNPKAEVIGTVNPQITETGPQGASASWTGPSGSIDLDEGPPPWELEDAGFTASDARRYVEVPENWELRWINPKLLESSGWRYWQSVQASDPRVKVKVGQMAAPDGTIRRGGTTGDILGWMYRSWVESGRRKLAEETARLTASAVNRQQVLREEFSQGKYGPYVRLEEARHPTHTNLEGRSLKD